AIVLISILSVMATARLDINPFRTASFQQELRSALRFAQKLAIASGCDVQVSVDAATDSYALNMRNDVNTGVPASCLSAVSATFDVPVRNPTGGNFARTAPTGIDITAGLTFVYNRRGVPSATGAIVVSGQTITVAGTGYVF
ncbi:MAG TPA: hypothetical protein VGL10_04915, partial [Gammaproteobacteria bacterium]